MDFNARFEQGLAYHDFLAKYGTDDQRNRWGRMHAAIRLSDQQRQLLAGFTRQMKIMCLAGAWCGDCVDQCPIFEHFAQANDQIQVRYFDRDDNADLHPQFSICGGARVPSVIFLSEDGAPTGRYGDRTLAKYRALAAPGIGGACSTGIGPATDPLAQAVLQEWLDQFERNQLILRTSPRLRQRYGD